MMRVFAASVTALGYYRGEPWAKALLLLKVGKPLAVTRYLAALENGNNAAFAPLTTRYLDAFKGVRPRVDAYTPSVEVHAGVQVYRRTWVDWGWKAEAVVIGTPTGVTSQVILTPESGGEPLWAYAAYSRRGKLLGEDWTIGDFPVERYEDVWVLGEDLEKAALPLRLFGALPVLTVAKRLQLLAWDLRSKARRPKLVSGDRVEEVEEIEVEA